MTAKTHGLRCGVVYLAWVGLMALGVATCGGGDEFTDGDGDGLAPPFDCDDANASIHPGAQEIPYDGIDQDCDGKDLVDVDRDGYEDESVEGGTDCDDGDASIHPDAAEIPYDGLDQDCDGTEDDKDGDSDGHDAESQGGDDCCDLGTEDALGCEPATAADMYPGAEEISYDGIDQDCNGLDYGGGSTESDDDQDGFVTDDVPEGIDCDDTDPDIFPGAIERCNGKDDDCDSHTDENLIDYDGDGACSCLDCDDYDARRSPMFEELPYDEIDQDCDGTDLVDVDGDGQNSIVVDFGQDCNDLNPEVYVGQTESCNHIDDDCDGETDEDFIGGSPDADLDGWLLCIDCDDTQASVNPGAPELPANTVDDDCDGLTDETDADGDGYYITPGAPSPADPDCCDAGDEPALGCSAGLAPSMHPGAIEIPYDGVDQDCDGADLEDADGDGHNAEAAGGDDCDDGNPNVHPGHAEDCGDPADNDCNGIINQLCGPGADEEVEVAAGYFLMGRTDEESVLNPDQQPRHEVDLDLYYIDKYEVSISQFRRCVVDGPCLLDSIPITSFSDENYWINQARGLHPAISISWQEARQYCLWVGKDLATEAQWEKAARGADPDERDYPWGDIEYQSGPGGSQVRQPISCERANHRSMCDQELCAPDVMPVNSHDTGTSPFGLHEMSGNVAEWIKDWYDPAYYTASPETNPPGPDTGTHRVIRGGTFLNIDYYLEVTARASGLPNARTNYLGFRCARLPP